VIALGDLASRLGLELSGDPGRPIRGLAPLDTAGPEQLSFVSAKKYLPGLASTRAGAVIIRAEWVDERSGDYLLSQNPYLSFARASQLFDNRPLPTPGIHATAVVADDAVVGADVSIGPHACIEAGAVLGDRVTVGAGAYIGHNSRIGPGTRIYPNAVIYHGVVIGADCTIHSLTTIGADGFGFAPGPGGWEKICQLGGVQIGDRVDIGTSTTIDRGALGDTIIADGVIIDNQVHIAHNCRIGKNTAIAGCVGIAGSTTIGENCTFAGQVGVADHVVICDNVHIAGQGRVLRSIDTPGAYTSGTHLLPSRDWTRAATRINQLESLFKRVNELEKRAGDDTNNGDSE
jgi:UDP-3-O-[3-hydroxymyristoyl] glucosamine N-acyltransferase